MGCIRVDKMVDYLGEPLRKTLKDESPYVRKTAVICVAKLFDLNPAMCVENGFLEMLQEMLNDGNPMVSPPLASLWRFLCASLRYCAWQ
jgi:AP-1 complex subunit beta-1